MTIPPKWVHEEMATLSRLLQKLDDEGRRAADTNSKWDAIRSDVDDYIGQSLPRDALAQYLPKSTRMLAKLGSGRFLALSITTKDPSLPLLSFKLDFRRTQPEIRLRLVLILPSNDEREFRTVGIRWESPEGPGQHNYYHCQWFHEMADGPLPYAAELPTCMPAIPVAADRPSQLLASMIMSLYGIGEFERWLREDGELQAALGAWIRERHGSDHKHFKVDLQDGHRVFRVWESGHQKFNKDTVREVLKSNAEYSYHKKLAFSDPTELEAAGAEELHWKESG